MQSDSRAALARLIYLRALKAARVAPTPRRWRKLVAAAKALRAAEREGERRWLAKFPRAARRLAAARRAAAASDGVLLTFRQPAPARRTAAPVSAAPGA